MTFVRGMNEQEVRASIADYIVTHARGTYRADLVRFQPDLAHSDTADLFFRAVPSGDGEPMTFQLHLSEDTVNNRGGLRDAIESTIAAILDGRLPPDTRELL